MADRALTMPEFAARLCVSRATAYRIVAAGEIDCVDVSCPGAKKTKLRVRESALERYLDRHEIPGRRAA